MNSEVTMPTAPSAARLSAADPAMAGSPANQTKGASTREDGAQGEKSSNETPAALHRAAAQIGRTDAQFLARQRLERDVLVGVR